MSIDIRIDDRPDGVFVLKTGPVMVEMNLADLQALELEAHAAVENYYLTDDGKAERGLSADYGEGEADEELYRNLRKPLNVIAVYERSRAYGGPEEGGWWYDCGELVTSLGVNSDDAVEYFAEALVREYPRTGNAGSVIYSGGDYAVMIFRRDSDTDIGYWLDERLEPVQHYPRETPRYE